MQASILCQVCVYGASVNEGLFLPWCPVNILKSCIFIYMLPVHYLECCALAMLTNKLIE